MHTLDAMKQRFSANSYDPSKPVTQEQIHTLIEAASQAPSAFNIQHARFLVVTEAAEREKLCEIALNQEKVKVAPAVFVILADTKAHEIFPKVVQRDVEAGIFDQQLGDHFNQMVQSIYANDPVKARDEAIRSGSMAAMNLMNAATELGLVTGPMIGFDPVALKESFNIDERFEPVMMITAGYEADGNWPKKTRLSVNDLSVIDAKTSAQHQFS